MDITIGKMASWLFGVLFILAGIGGLVTSPVSGVIYFLTGIFLIPNVRQEIDERFDVTFSRWVVVLIAVIGMGLGGAMMAGGDIDTDTTPTTDANNQEQAPDTENQEQSQTGLEEDTELTREDRTHEIGNEFTVGDVRYQVNGVTTKERIGESSYGTFMGVEANGKYLIVDATVMNEASEAITMRESSLKVIIDEATYDPSSDAWVYMDESFTFEQLNPGVQVDGDVAYDVPASASTSSMELKVNPVGLFDTSEPHYVSLG